MRLFAEFYKKVKETTATPAEIKKELRAALKHERNLLKQQAHRESWGPMQVRRTLAELRTHARFHADVQFASYFPIQSELDVRSYATSSWIFPRVQGNQLLWFYLGDDAQFAPPAQNKFSIPEAAAEKCFALSEIQKPIVMFVPCLAVSVAGQRIGYGGGFYDRALSTVKSENILTVACVHSQLLFDELPSESFDKTVDCIATETNFIATGSF